MKKSGIHKQIQRKMLLYLDGDLREAEAELVRSHADACPVCSQMLENYRRLWKHPYESKEAVPSQKLWNHIQARLNEMEDTRPFFLQLRGFIHRYAFPVFMAVMVSLAVAAGAVIGSSGRQLSFKSSSGLIRDGNIAEELQLGLFDIAPPGSLTEIFDGTGQSGPAGK